MDIDLTQFDYNKDKKISSSELISSFLKFGLTDNEKNILSRNPRKFEDETKKVFSKEGLKIEDGAIDSIKVLNEHGLIPSPSPQLTEKSKQR